jgi:hypothetical protein
MERENERERKKKKSAEFAKIFKLTGFLNFKFFSKFVELAEKFDPRVIKFREEQKMKKEMAKQAKQEIARKQKEEVKKFFYTILL